MSHARVEVRALTGLDMACEIVSLHKQLAGAIEAVERGEPLWCNYCEPDAPLAEKIDGMAKACAYWRTVAGEH